MRIGIFIGVHKGIDDLTEKVRAVADDGFPSAWLPQVFDVDALTALAIVGRSVSGIELGTAVVPTYPRHPVILAQQALTTQAATGNRLVLGIGLSHKMVIEGMFGLSFDKPVRHMREYLSVLLPLLRDGTVSFSGETVKAEATVAVAGAEPCPVILAALGPKMLELAGTEADGTVTWMVGPKTLRSHIAPAITGAADKAGRPEPHIVASLPVCVTDDVTAARERAARNFVIYGTLPSYRAMLDREGVDGPADIAVVGDEDTVRAQLEEIGAAGAETFVANEFGSREERDRTRALLKDLV